MTRTLLLFAVSPLAIAVPAAAQSQSQSGQQNADAAAEAPGQPPFETREVADLDEPWAMTFLPDGRMLVTEKQGRLHVVTQEGEVSEPISGVPEVDYGGQGGLGDVVLSPDFENDNLVYLTYAEAGEGDTRGAAMGRGTLNLDTMQLEGFERLWQQVPKVTGRGHYSHRIAFSPDGQYLFLTSGERQKQDPAQDRTNNLGSVLRLTLDGEPAAGNPFENEESPTDQIWSYGHRNLLGIAFDADGQLWEQEMGPKGGDEFQLIERGKNYGWPRRSYGDNYSGEPIPDHTEDDGYEKPDEWWNPVISPSGLMIYDGDRFADWTGNAFIGGLSSKSLVRITFDCELDGRDVCEAERYDMGTRIREVEQGPDGTIWLLEDGGKGSKGRVLQLTPRA